MGSRATAAGSPAGSRDGSGGGPLLVVYTGGTFGMRDAGRGLEPVAELRSEIARLVALHETGRHQADPAGAPGARGLPWEYATTARVIDSAEAGHGTALGIADLIRDRLAETPHRGVLVVHGTDTLAYAAAETAFALADVPVPVVFTGAQLPLGTPGGDAERNFLEALVLAAARGRAGVHVAFAGETLPAVRVTKRSSESLDAFVAHRPLAEHGVDAALLEALKPRLSAAAGAASPEAGVLKVVPGLPAGLLRAAVAAFPAGLVLECYGAGTAPVTARTPDGTLLEALREAVADGYPVVAVTQCETGRVHLPRYAVGAELARSGVVDGHDLTTEAALGKLRVLVRAGLEGQELRTALEANLVGEMLTS